MEKMANLSVEERTEDCCSQERIKNKCAGINSFIAPQV